MTTTERKPHVSLDCLPYSPTYGGGMIAEAVLATALALSASPAAHHAAHIPADQSTFASCVSDRESHGNYRARGDESSAMGRWQFLDKQWRFGLAYMVADRLHRFGMSRAAAHDLRIHLQSISIDKWAPVYQDAGFLEVLNARGKWSGWRHWYAPGSRCNALAGRS
jgi:hypothetical protein